MNEIADTKTSITKPTVASKPSDQSVIKWVAERSVRAASTKRWRMYCIGSAADVNADVNARAVAKLSELAPHAVIKGHSGYFELGMSNLSTLGDNLLDEIQDVVSKHVHRIDKRCIDPKVKWGKGLKPAIAPVQQEYAYG